MMVTVICYSSIIPLQIWTSTRRRAHHTAWPFLYDALPPPDVHAPTTSSSLTESLSPESAITTTPSTKSYAPALNVKVIEKPQMSEINPGIWDGLTPDQARKYYPQDWERFVRDPYSFRAPRAESYHDLSGTTSSSFRQHPL
jgi:6-phosphofructo-2-kinase / fructose-2,6-biphosphatase 4